MKIISRHIEWGVLLTGLILMAILNPYSDAPTWCLLERAGIFCLGEGLGHSIAFLFRGQIMESFSANLMGPFAVVILSARIIKIWSNLVKQNSQGFTGEHNVKGTGPDTGSSRG